MESIKITNKSNCGSNKFGKSTTSQRIKCGMQQVQQCQLLWIYSYYRALGGKVITETQLILHTELGCLYIWVYPKYCCG